MCIFYSQRYYWTIPGTLAKLDLASDMEQPQTQRNVIETCSFAHIS